MKMNGLKLFVLSIGIMTSFSSYNAFGQNNYPILQKINNTEVLFPKGYTFEDCKKIVEKLQLDIERFERNGTVADADNMKEAFFKAMWVIVRALLDLENSVDDNSMRRKINEYRCEKLDNYIVFPVLSAYNEALKRK